MKRIIVDLFSCQDFWSVDLIFKYQYTEPRIFWLSVEKDRDPMDVLRISTRLVRKKFGISESVIQIEEYHPGMS